MAERKRGTPGAPVLPTVLRPATSPYRRNTVHAAGDVDDVTSDTPNETPEAGAAATAAKYGKSVRVGPGSVRSEPGAASAPQAEIAPVATRPAAVKDAPTDPARARPDPPARRSSRRPRRPDVDAGIPSLEPTLKISTRIPIVPALEARLAILMRDYDMTAREARPLMLKPLFARLRQICQTGEIPDLTFVRVPKDLVRIPTTLSIPREVFAAFSACVDRHAALSKSAVLESVLFQLLGQMETDGALP